MRCFAAASRYFAGLAFASLAVLSFAMGAPAAAQQANTSVDAVVCSGNSSNAALTVASPQSDSVVNHAPITIQGTAENITQIDSYVNGVYSGTVAVSAQQTSYTLSQNLSEGTHTITLIGNDVCNYQDVTIDLVITYHPLAPPPLLVDNGVPVDPQPATGTGAPSGAAVTDNTTSQASPSFRDRLHPILLRIARALDVDATARSGGALRAIVRVVSFTVGMTLVLFGGLFVKTVHVWRLRHADGFALRDPRLATRLRAWRIGAVVAGVVLTAVAFIV